jgi:hypothetical protein
MRELTSIELQAVSGGATAILKSAPICRRPIRVVCRPERPQTLDGRTLEGRCGGTPVAFNAA